MELITIRTFDNAIDAHLLKATLENEGIESMIFDENVVSLNPLYNITVGGIKLKVLQEDAEDAIKIMEAINNKPYTNENDEIIRCPKCRSSELYSGFKSMKGVAGFLSAVTSLALSVFPIYYQSVYRCKECQTEFKER